MLQIKSLNQKRLKNIHSHHDSSYNEKQNNQKNLNIGKKSARLSQLENCLKVKLVDHKNYLTNADNKLNLSLNYNSTQPTGQIKNKMSARNSLQKNRVESLIKNEKRKTNTSQFCQLYGKDILTEYELKPIHKSDFLKSHQVNTLLRARMLDWMVQVMKSYKFINKSYFSSVQLLDRYFTQIKEKIPVSQLHIAGVTVMYIATKMQEIYPLKIKTVYQKIVHKKISKQALIDMEMKIFDVLNYKVNSWTFFDLAVLKIANQFQDQDEKVQQKIEEVAGFVSKCIVYDYDLYTRYDMETFAKVVAKITMKICNLEGKTQGYSMSCHEDIAKSHKSFKTNFKGLVNIFKFSDQKIVSAVNSYFSEF